MCLLILDVLTNCYLSIVSLGSGYYGATAYIVVVLYFKLNKTPFYLDHRLKWNYCKVFLCSVLLNLGQVFWIYYVTYLSSKRYLLRNTIMEFCIDFAKKQMHCDILQSLRFRRYKKIKSQDRE